MHPRDAEAFDWTHPEDEAELRAHRISQSEVMQVYLGNHVWARDKKMAAGDYLMIGYTNGGRPLTIVIACEEVFATIRAITGWDCTPGERTRFLKKRIGGHR
jgi:uncharacterized DUF497 family protein